MRQSPTIPPIVDFCGQKHYRIIPSIYPPINFFEDLVEHEEMETVWEIENLTNERLRQEAGDIFLVAPKDCHAGPGASVVMAAFTHVGKASRFTDGSYGIYYASLSYETAIRETVYHRELFLQATNEAALELSMRSYESTIQQPLHDVRNAEFNYLHDPANYSLSQEFGKEMRAQQSWGLVYRSVRHEHGQCIAAFKPQTISIPRPLAHLRYVWNGEKITEVLDTTSVMQL